MESSITQYLYKKKQLEAKKFPIIKFFLSRKVKRFAVP